MKIQSRVFLIIIMITFMMIVFSMSMVIMMHRTNVKTAQEQDLSFVAQTADYYVSAEIRTIKLRGEKLAYYYSISGETERQAKLDSLITEYQEFIGAAVIDRAGNLITAAGNSPAHAGIIENRHVKWAFYGKSGISTTYPLDGGMVFYVGIPIPDISNQILVVTLPGHYFIEMLSTLVIWETGYIFIDDADGYIIANRNLEWVDTRANFILQALADPDYEDIADTVRRGISGESGVSYFSISDVPRLCAFRPISGSDEGWFLGVVAPLNESPFNSVERAMLGVAVICIILSIIAALVASAYIKKPFEQIAVLKEEAENFAKTKSDFLAKMSHEIRTPMNVVLGVTDVNLQKKDLSEEYRDSFEKIYSASDLLMHIINDILDLSKIEAGKMELKITKYEMASLISDVVNQNKIMFAEKTIAFSLEVAEDIPMELYGDEFRIRQILNNIISNAFKYTEKGGVSLSFTCEEINPNEINLVFRVSDTGQGLSTEQIDLIFDEYARFNKDKNHAIAGTGLGLPITYNLVNMMNGEIDIESKVGIGSTFIIRFPQKKAGNTLFGHELAEKFKSFQLSDISREKKAKLVREAMPYGRVLVVDDIITNIEVAKLLLKPYEMDVDEADSGIQAINKIKDGEVYDIIFMDYMMPEIDGIEATKTIRAMGYKKPIIALTANAVIGQEELFARNGFDGFVSKPIDIRQLNDVLKKYVKRSDH